MDDALQQHTVVFTGRVQGVFFRATTQSVARDFTVSGWVRNEPNGTVRCVVEGDAGELERFVDAVVAAKRDNIDDYRVEKSRATGAFDGFRVR